MKRSTHVLLGEGSGKILTCSCWEKGNFIIINEFKYGQTWKIWPSPLNLSLYNPFKLFCHGSKRGTQDIDICQNDYNIPFKLEFPLILKSYNESITFNLTKGFHSLIFFILMYQTISIINKSRPCYFVTHRKKIRMINLLNYNYHRPTNKFLDSNCFLPYILQPIHLACHSKH